MQSTLSLLHAAVIAVQERADRHVAHGSSRVAMLFEAAADKLSDGINLLHDALNAQDEMDGPEYEPAGVTGAAAEAECVR